jgi:hypothetical protein
MAKGLIERIELKITGEKWNEVSISEYNNGRRLEHIYYSVAKDVVMKLLNSSKNPTVSDFDSWVREADEKQKKNNDKTDVCPMEGNDWFSAR